MQYVFEYKDESAQDADMTHEGFANSVMGNTDMLAEMDAFRDQLGSGLD